MTGESQLAWRRFRRHWISDPLTGARLFAAHESLRLLPTDTVSALGGRLASQIGPRLHPRVDERIRAGLTALRPDLVPDAAALDAEATQAWDSVGRSYAEFSVEDRVWSEGRVSVEGQENLLAHQVKGRPLIVIGVHTGNWELIPITLGWLGHSVLQVYQPPRNRFEADIATRSRRRAEHAVRKRRPDLSLQLVPPSRSAGFELTRAMQRGAVLMIFGDESVGGRVRAPSFGRTLRTDNNMGRVSRLARITGAAVVPAYCTRQAGQARYTVRFLPSLPMRSTSDVRDDTRANVSDLDAVLSPLVIENIDQWYMLVDLHLQS